MSSTLFMGLIFVSGLVLGFLFGWSLFGVLSSRFDGKLTIDDSEETRTCWVLRYDGDPDKITKKKSIRLRIDTKEQAAKIGLEK